MSLTDVTSRVLTIYSADAKEQIAELKALKGAISEVQKQELAAHEQRNEQAETWLKGLAKISVGLFAVKEAIGLVWDGYKDKIRDAQLANAAMGVSIDSLKEASHGLMTEQQLLAIAAKENHSAFKLTQEQMDVSVKAMIALERRGVDASEAINAVTTAMVSGKTKGLEPYGIVVDKHIQKLQEMGEENLTLAQRQEIFNGAYKELAKLSGTVVDGQDAAGEAMQRSINQAKDAWENFKKSLGNLAESFGPVIQAVGVLIQKLAFLQDKLNLFSPFGGIAINAPTGSAVQAGLDAVLASGRVRSPVSQALDKYLYGAFDADQPEHYASFDKQPGARTAPLDELSADAKKALEDARRLDEEVMKNHITALEKMMSTSSSVDPKTGKRFSLEEYQKNLYNEQQKAWDFAQTQHEERLRQQFAQREERETRDKRYSAFNAKQEASFLEKTFGKISDFDIYSEAFKALSGAVSSSMSAWIDGSESAGKAFQRFIADALKGLATQMLVESLKFGAYALGALAFGDVQHAAWFAETSAEFAAGALIAGAAAKELGGGGSAGSSAGGGSRPSAPNVGGTGSGGVVPQQTVIVVGDAFANDSPYMRQVTAQKIVSVATHGSAGGHG